MTRLSLLAAAATAAFVMSGGVSAYAAAGPQMAAPGYQAQAKYSHHRHYRKVRRQHKAFGSHKRTVRVDRRTDVTPVPYTGPNRYSKRFYGPRNQIAAAGPSSPQSKLRRQHQAYSAAHKQTIRRDRYSAYAAAPYIGPNRYSKRFYGPRVQTAANGPNTPQSKLRRQHQAYSAAHKNTIRAERYTTGMAAPVKPLKAPRD